MNGLKYFSLNFILYYYLNFIREDWNLLNKLGKIMIYPAWLIKSTLYWIISPIFIILYFLRENETIFIIE